MKYMVSTENDFGREFSCAKPYEVLDAMDAANAFVEENFANLEYPTEIDVFVKSPDGVVTEWIVTVESVPQFHASEKKGK